MKQYCRYCAHLTVNNFPYCEVKKTERSESSCKRPNRCKDFDFANCPPEFQDAFGETKGYKPRKTKNKEQAEEQMELFKVMAGASFLDESCETIDTARLEFPKVSDVFRSLPKANCFNKPPEVIEVVPIDDCVKRTVKKHE